MSQHENSPNINPPTVNPPTVNPHGQQSDTVDGMRIWHLSLPVRHPRDHGIGTVAGNVEIVLVKVNSAQGGTGWGEASPWPVFTGTAEATVAALQRYLSPVVMGRELCDIPAIMQDAERSLVGHPEAKAAMETALLDLFARSIGQPVWALLGGRYRSKIPLSVSLADPDFSRDRELMARIYTDGIRIIKLKTGVQDHAFDLLRLERLRADYPDVDIRADYNQGMQPFDALRRLRDLDCFKLGFIEQPVPAAQRQAMARLCAAIDTPLLADESAFDPAEAFVAMRDRICDGLSVKIMKCGGLRRGQQIAAIAAAAGMPAYGGDMFEASVAHLAGAHMIAATGNFSLGCEFYQARYYLQEDILAKPFPIVDGHVVVPNTPGLGIDVDEARVKPFIVSGVETKQSR